jgi:hypothetical protein
MNVYAVLLRKVLNMIYFGRFPTICSQACVNRLFSPDKAEVVYTASGFMTRSEECSVKLSDAVSTIIKYRDFTSYKPNSPIDSSQI